MQIDFFSPLAAFIPESVQAAEIFGNSLLAYTYAGVLFVGLAVIFKIVQLVVLQRLHAFAERTDTNLDDVLVRIVKSIRSGFYVFVAFYVAFQTLAFPELLVNFVTAILLVWVVYQVVRAFQILIDFAIESREQKQDTRESKMALRYLGRIGKWTLWVIGIMLVLSNLGVNITSLVAGLGIGGVAIAFALQAILGDLFASFSIFFDKPFIIGDFIQVGNQTGTVERIGIKTTRLRALSGEEVVISNAEMTSSRVHNYGRISERRDVFTLGVAYETTPKALRNIPEIIEKIITAQEHARFDRAHLKTFGDSALIFEVVYFVESSDYTVFMDIKQTVNIQILEALEKEGVAIAYPVMDVRLQKEK